MRRYLVIDVLYVFVSGAIFTLFFRLFFSLNIYEDISNVRTLWYSSFWIGRIIIILFIIFLLFWGTFADFLNSNREVADYSIKAKGLLIIPYILLALDMVTDSIFYGVGKTKFQAYQAIITNGTVYVIAFILYLTKV